MSDDEVQSSVLYKDKPEWSDVRPIYPTQDEISAVKIAAGEQFTDAFAYLRAVLQTGEKSERVLQLTEDCIGLNAANYTLWQYRRDTLKALGKNLQSELDFLSDIIYENPKNYQVWHHRRCIIEWMGKPEQELAFTADILEDESKNYHAWQHRQWAIRHFSLPLDPELDYSMKLILEDARNNSAWNYRFFILKLADKLADPKTIDTEVNLALRLLEKIPRNESVWNYLAGILVDGGLTSRPDVIDCVKKLYAETEKSKRAPHLLSFLVDILSERIEKKENVIGNAEEAKKLLDELTTIDPVRTNFWSYRKLMIESALQKELLAPNA